MINEMYPRSDPRSVIGEKYRGVWKECVHGVTGRFLLRHWLMVKHSQYQESNVVSMCITLCEEFMFWHVYHDVCIDYFTGICNRDEVIHLHHDTQEAGHPGWFKTAELILQNYWWPRICGDVWAYVDGCSRCQQTKTFPEKPRGKLSPNEIPQRIWQHISVDLITQLPSS